MSTFPSGFDNAVSVTGTDYLLVNNKRATVDQLAAAIGANNGVLASWNGANLNQFDAPVTSGFTNPALTVVTTGSSTVLSFTADAAAGGAYYLRYFAAPVPMQSMRGRAWVIRAAYTAGDTICGRLAVAGAAVAPPLVNVVLLGTNDTETTLASFGAANGSNPGTGADWPSGSSGVLSFDIFWQQSGGFEPTYALTSTTTGIDANGSFAGIPGFDLPAVDSEWASATPDKVGIYFWAGTGGATNPVEIVMWDIKFEAR